MSHARNQHPPPIGGKPARRCAFPAAAASLNSRRPATATRAAAPEERSGRCARIATGWRVPEGRCPTLRSARAAGPGFRRLERRPKFHPTCLHGSRVAHQILMLRLESAMHGILAKLLFDQRPFRGDRSNALLDLLDLSAQPPQSAPRPQDGTPRAPCRGLPRLDARPQALLVVVHISFEVIRLAAGYPLQPIPARLRHVTTCAPDHRCSNG